MSLRSVSFLAGALALSIAACGGGDDTPDEVTVTLRPLLTDSSLDPASVRGQVAAVAEARAESYTEVDATAEIVGDTIQITIPDISRETAESLLGRRGILDFRGPIIVEGLVLCRAADGSEFVVDPSLVNPDPASGQLARCFTANTVGTPLWETATAVDAPGAPAEALSNDSIVPDGWSVDESEPPALRAEFTPEDTLLLEAITNELAGYRLGIFVDTELIAAPVIQRAITDGRPVISGFDLERARLYAAMLNGGVHPTDVEVVQQAGGE